MNLFIFPTFFSVNVELFLVADFATQYLQYNTIHEKKKLYGMICIRDYLQNIVHNAE